MTELPVGWADSLGSGRGGTHRSGAPQQGAKRQWSCQCLGQAHSGPEEGALTGVRLPSWLLSYEGVAGGPGGLLWSGGACSPRPETPHQASKPQWICQCVAGPTWDRARVHSLARRFPAHCQAVMELLVNQAGHLQSGGGGRSQA